MVTRWEITKAVRRSDLPAPSRLIMFTLADVAEVGTAEIPPNFTPSLSVLTAETGLDRRTVQRHLAVLEEAGWIIRTRPNEKAQWLGERVRYRLDLPSGIEPPEVAESPQGGGTETPGVAAQSPKGGGTEPPLSTDQSDQDQISMPRKRGSRIPNDFAVDDDMREWARKTVPHLAGRGETEKFVDYWQAASGRNAVKRDWRAAWRVWMRNAAERWPSNGRASPNQLPPSSAPVPLAPDEQCPEHRGQREGRCRYCAADAKARGAR